MGYKKPEDDIEDFNNDDTAIDLNKPFPANVDGINDFLEDDFMVVIAGISIIREEMGVVEQDADKEFTNEAWRRINELINKEAISADEVKTAMKMAADFKWKAIIGVGIDANQDEINAAEKIWKEKSWGNFESRLRLAMAEKKDPIDE